MTAGLRDASEKYREWILRDAHSDRVCIVQDLTPPFRGFSADTALHLARYFGTSDRFWLNLQARYDLEVERDHLGARLERDVRILDRAS